MFRADAAGFDEVFAERGAGAVGADGCVGWGDVLLGCKLLQGLLAEVDGAQKLGVIGMDGVEHAGEAGTDVALCLRWRSGLALELFAPLFEGVVFGGAAAVLVDDGVAQDPIEPADDGFAGVELAFAFESAEIGGLEDVFGDSWIGHAALHEAKELATVVEERVEGGGGHGASEAGDL